MNTKIKSVLFNNIHIYVVIVLTFLNIQPISDKSMVRRDLCGWHLNVESLVININT